MIRQIDHITIGVLDLALAKRDYEQLGFSLVDGGEHPGAGTRNMLVTFADGSYLELIAFSEAGRRHRLWSRLQRGEGVLDYAVLTDDIQGEARRLSGAGFPIHGPLTGSRVRPDGTELVMRVLRITSPDEWSPLPFLIEDVTPRSLRVPPQAAAHACGAAGLQALRVVGGQAGAPAALGTLLGSGAHTSDGARFAVGPQFIDFREATGQPVSYQIVLDSGGPKPRAWRFDGDRAHGAAMTFASADWPRAADVRSNDL